MKIERGEDFFVVDLAWNDPHAKTDLKVCILSILSLVTVEK